jgi:hypothetical protein
VQREPVRSEAVSAAQRFARDAWLRIIRIARQIKIHENI